MAAVVVEGTDGALADRLSAVQAALAQIPLSAYAGLSPAEARRVAAQVRGLESVLRTHVGAAVRAVERLVPARDTRQLLAADFGLDVGAAHRELRQARTLAMAPAAEQAAAGGVISHAHATVIGQAIAALPRETMPTQREQAEQVLIADARRLSPKDLQSRARRITELWQTCEQTDAVENGLLARREAAAYQKVSLTMWDNRDGTWTGRFVLPDLQARMLKTVIDALAAPRRSHLRASDHSAPTAVDLAAAASTAADLTVSDRAGAEPDGSGPLGAGVTGSDGLGVTGSGVTGPDGLGVTGSGVTGSDGLGVTGPDGLELTGSNRSGLGVVVGGVKRSSEGERSSLSGRWSQGRVQRARAEERLRADVDKPYDRKAGEALAALVEHLPTDGFPATGGTPAHIMVTIDEARLRGQVAAATLSTGERISAGELRRLACGHGILPAVLGGASVPVDLGRSQRLFSRQQRDALAVLDGGCVTPGCDRPPAWCEAHHGGSPFSQGGLTNLDQGYLLCSGHHHEAHQQRWRFRRTPAGVAQIDRGHGWEHNHRYRPRETAGSGITKSLGHRQE
ncbi:MAG: DUF222 domain-containing protein [Propionicimonas sp.]|nr:DUF222 domain-containing protein [Propionicimonas sp.]